MKYLAIFEYQNLTAAETFDTKASASSYVKKCATAAKTAALSSDSSDKYLIEIKNQNAEIKARIEAVDTNVKYQLITRKNQNVTDIAYYDTRKAAETAAHEILDAAGFEASTSEDQNGEWSATPKDSSDTLTITLRLVLKSSSDDVVASYSATNMEYFCAHFADAKAELEVSNQLITAEVLKSARKKGLTNLGIGIAIAVVGIIISFISYQTAKAGERYTIYTGIIAIGVIDALCGLYYLINPKAALPKDKRPKKRK